VETSDSPKLSLPENAYRKLNPGEEYRPIVPADRPLPEATPYSIGWGLFYAVLFSAGAAYLGLKIGQVFEAAIPIAILAVGASAALKRKNALSENVIIQSIGAASGVIVAGAIFTLPGLYILGLQASFLQVFLSSLLGGFLGILFLIPFRRFFVKDMHGEFPFPEATATTEILVAGEAGGDQARILLGGAVVGGVYDFLVSGLGAWKEVVSTTVFGWGQRLADTIKWEFRINVGAAVTGLGYIIGLRYAAIICAGSFTAWWVLVPLVYFIGSHVGEPFATRSGLTIAQMPPIQIFADYVRHVGIGGIAAAGIIGVLKSWRIIVGAFKLALREFTGGVHAAAGKTERTQTDVAMKWVTTAILATIIGTFVFFRFSVVDSLFHAVVGLVVVTVIAFLFTTVAARAIAIVGVNPVSGMTLMTLIISSVVLLKVGVTGRTGILAALIIGGVVCTALSMAGGFITDLKIGYWLGTTPRTQERWKFLGTLAAAASVGLVIMMLNQVYGFGVPTPEHPAALAAPQASAMAAVIEPLMTGQPAPWLLYIAGGFLALVLEIVSVPPLAFALGMYLPIELNTPLLFGGLVAWYVSTRSKDDKLNTERRERGTLIASGFIAGGAIMGVIAATLNFGGDSLIEKGWKLNAAIGLEHWGESVPAEALGFAMYALLLIFFAWMVMRKPSSSK
jgi:putative OPT family oligopeptide transporter